MLSRGWGDRKFKATKTAETRAAHPEGRRRPVQRRPTPVPHLINTRHSFVLSTTLIVSFCRCHSFDVQTGREGEGEAYLRFAPRLGTSVPTRLAHGNCHRQGRLTLPKISLSLVIDSINEAVVSDCWKCPGETPQTLSSPFLGQPHDNPATIRSNPRTTTTNAFASFYGNRIRLSDRETSPRLPSLGRQWHATSESITVAIG